MMRLKTFALILLALSTVLISCRKDDENPKNGDQNGNGNGNGGEIVSCNDTLKPIVFIHGFLASGDTYANHVMRFGSNQYCEDRMFVFDWNTLAQGADNISTLDAFIDDVLQKTGSSRVMLAGHSAGGGLSYNYLSAPERAEKVYRYVHIGSFAESGPAGSNEDVPTLNIWSQDDKVVESGDIPGAENVHLPGQDHYEVATSAEAFRAMYKFFNEGEEPTTLNIEPQAEVKVSGRVVTLGENSPRAEADIKIYAVNAENGSRKNENPDFSIKSDGNGHWGPISVTPNQTYEFEVNTGTSGDRTIYYYREGFSRSNPLVYLRTLPPPGSPLNFVTGGLPEDDGQSVLIVFTASQGVLAGRDELKVDGFELSIPEFTDAESNSIAFFLYDGNQNQQTDLTAQGIFGTFPFLEGIDMYFQTDTPTAIECELNGKKLNVRNRKSGSEGIVIAVFD